MKLNIITLTILKLTFHFCLFTFAVLVLASCTPTEPVINPPPQIKDTLSISIIYKTYRSISVNVKTTNNSAVNSSTGAEIKLIRKKEGERDTLVSKYNASVLDTTITDDNNGKGLQPNTAYTYYSIRTDSSGSAKDSSNFITVKTLGITSNNYVWEEKIIGDDGYYNELDDVWGTDENNVYAVGGFKVNDNFYGILHWNGSNWIPIANAGGKTIFGFSANDIWVAGGGVFHYDGNTWNQIDSKLVNNQAVILDTVLFENSEYTCIWGTSSNNLYLGNLWGRIVHWDGSKASLMDVQTNNGEGFRDIYGLDENTIYAVSGNDNGQRTGAIYSLENGQWIQINKAPSSVSGNELISPFNSVWLENNYELYIANGGGVGRRRNNVWEQIDVGFYGERIRGYASNNIFVTGDFGNVTHFNGKEWYHYGELEKNSDIFTGILVFNRVVFIIGIRVQQGLGIKGLILTGALN